MAIQLEMDAYLMSALAALILFHTYASHSFVEHAKSGRCRVSDWRCWWTKYGMLTVGLASAGYLAYASYQNRADLSQSAFGVRFIQG